MAKGISLHIGINTVNPADYEGWSGPLAACEFDANDMASIAKLQGFAKSKILLTKQATRAAVLRQIDEAATSLKSGDIFFLTYSGHGGQLPDLNSDESDGADETWCLYDGQIVDDQIFLALSKFGKGVRILMLSDSCHSGSVAKLNRFGAPMESTARTRAMPRDVAQRIYYAHRKQYDPILKAKAGEKALETAKASIILISGCQDNQESLDGTYNGLFTSTLKQVWNGGKYKTPSYASFHKAILTRMPADQSPNLFKAGTPNPGFERQVPFSV